MKLFSSLALLSLFLLNACDEGSMDEAGSFEENGGGAFIDAGSAGTGEAAEADPHEGAPCEQDEHCASGYLCFRGGCVFQGRDASLSDGDAGPVELEEEWIALNPPVVDEEQLWISNPSTDSLLRIHADDLSLEVLRLGENPSQTLLSPNGRILVLNLGSDELALVDEDQLEFWALGAHFNRMSLDPSGRWLLFYLDLQLVVPGEAVSTLQDVLVLDLEQKKEHWVAVGYAPEEIIFRGETGFVLTSDGLSIIDLSAPPAVAPRLPLALNIFLEADREVFISPDARFVISRGPRELGVTLVELPNGQPQFIDLGAEPSDLDLLPDGQTALVMLRSASALVLLPLERPESLRRLELEASLGAAVVGTETALLYTTLELAPLALLDLEAERLIYKPLRRGLRGALLDPGGEAAILWHTEEPQEGAAYSLLRLSDGFIRFLPSPSSPLGAHFGQGRALLRLKQPPSLQIIDLQRFQIETMPLGSSPEYAGFVGEGIFVLQTHPEGRISFADRNGEGVRSLSGYLLNGRIQ